jgi:Leucine-rich repeat (LRR) protein
MWLLLLSLEIWSGLNDRHQLTLALRREGCSVAIRQNWLCRYVSPVFGEVAGVSIDSDHVKVSATQLLNRVTRYRDLKSLAINGVPIRDLSFLNLLPQIRALSITDAGLTDDKLGPLRELKNLGSLDLSFNPLNGSGLKYVPSSAPLRTLYVAHTNLQAVNLRLLGRFRLLEDLIIDGNDLDDVALSALPTLGSLAVLEANGTKVGNASLRWITALPNLETLSLQNTKVDDESIAQLQTLRLLNLLDLSATKVTDGGSVRLKQSNEDLTLLWSPSE